MHLFHFTAGPGIGLFPTSTGGIPMMNRSGEATAIGELMYVDMIGSDAATVGITPGAEDYVFANVIDVPSAAAQIAADGQIGIFCVATAVAADDAEVRVDVCGRVSALVRGDGSVDPSPGSPLVAVAAAESYLDVTPAINGKEIAIWHAAAESNLAAANVLRQVWLNGWAGLYFSQRVT